MKCTSCGEQVLSTEKFCKNCGKAIEQKKVCSSCGESVLSTEKFCKNCGKAIEQKNENNVVEEISDKKVVLTFEEDLNLPKLYSKKAILLFSGWFTLIAGAFLLQANLKTLNKRSNIKFVWLGALASIGLLFLIPDDIPNGFSIGISVFVNCGLAFFYWKNFIGDEVKYTNRSMKKPLIWAFSILSVIVFLVVLFVVFSADADNDADEIANTESSYKYADNEPKTQITATDLYAAYKNNAVAADNKYTGKTLIVTGYIFEITKNYDGIYFVILDNKGANGFSSTFCYFPANRNSSLSSLQKGQFLSIKGKCIGRGADNIFPKLENCSLEDNRQQKKEENSFNDEQTEYYKYYLYGESGGEWEAFKVKIIFGNKDIKVVASEGTRTFIIVGSPKYDEYNDGTTYKVYYSDNANKDILEITRYKDRTHIQYIPECGEYEIYQKNKPEGY